MSPRARVAAAALALTASMGLSACGTASPVQTDVAYNAADGVPVDLGPVLLRNLALVSDAKGGNATVTGQAINNSDQATEVTFAQASGASAKVALPAHSSTSMSSTAQVVLPGLTVAPGDLLALNVTSPQGGSAAVNVPVLDARGYYATMAPTAVPATPAPTTSAN